MFELYTESARRAVYGARVAAEGSKRIEVDHLLVGLVNVEPCLKGSALAQNAKLSVEAKPSAARDMSLSYAAKRVLAYAAEEGVQPHGEINCLHLALGILREGKSEAARLLNTNGFTRERILSLLPPAKPLPPRSWIQANQHVAVFCFGFALWLILHAFVVWQIWQVPVEERGDRIVRLSMLLALPLFVVVSSFSLAIGLSLFGFGFYSRGRFPARSRMLVPLACAAVYLVHRIAFILLT